MTVTFPRACDADQAAAAGAGPSPTSTSQGAADARISVGFAGAVTGPIGFVLSEHAEKAIGYDGAAPAGFVPSE